MKKGRSERALSRPHSGRNAVGLDPGWLQTSILQDRIPPAALLSLEGGAGPKNHSPFLNSCPAAR